jgi:hypothetical protein
VTRALVGAAVAGTTVMAAALTTTSMAAADAAGGAITDDSGIGYGVAINADSGGGRSPNTRGRTGSGPSCTYTLMGGPENFPVFDPDGSVVEVTSGGHWYEKTCDGVFGGAVYLTGPPNTVDPAALAAGVLKRMTIPVPQIGFSPNGDQIVNLPSWLWIPNWEPLTGSATVGGVTVRVTARPGSAHWTFGDGSSSSCAPGIAWAPEADPTRACTHTWARSSASQPNESYRLTVTVGWEASYSVSGGAGGGALAPLSRTSSTQLRVAEVQAINSRAGR